MEPLAYCNVLLIAITCWVSYLGFRSRQFESRYIFWPDAIFGGQYERVVTSGFLHANGRHLLFNMISLYLFGSMIELEYGAAQFLEIYFASIIGGGLLSLFIHRFHDYRAYGASGGVCGVVFAHIFLFPGGSICMFFVPRGIPAWLYAIGFLTGSFWAMKLKRDNIGHDAHLGGAMAGVLITVALHPRVVVESPKLFAAVTLILAAILFILARDPFLTMPVSPAKWFDKFKKRPRPMPAKLRLKVDDLLDKVSEKGIHSLTREEHAFLIETSAKYQRRAQSEKPKSELLF